MGSLRVAAGTWALLLTACTDPDQAAAPADPTPAPTPSSPSPTQTEPSLTQPLGLFMHATRRPMSIPDRVARRVVAGEVRSWSAFGVGARPLRIVDTVNGVVRDRDAVAVLPAGDADPRVQAIEVAGVDPIADPASYPVQVPADTKPGPVVTMSIVGDIMLGRGVERIGAAAGDLSLALRPMSSRLASADITVGNLENTLSDDGEPRQGDDSFAASPRVRSGLRDAGFDVIGLANNHLGDFGDQALVETVRLLRRGGFETFGAGATPQVARHPAVVERAGVRFGFVGFNAIGETPEVAPGEPGAVSVSMPPRTGPLDRSELDRFLSGVRRLEGRVDVVVAMPHWGTQYTNVPEPIQRRIARALVRAGADLVVGGHPHWVQGTEMVGDTLVAHSLGNFIFDMDFMEETQEGLLLELTYWGPELMAADFVPYHMDGDFAPRLVSYPQGRDILDLMWETSSPAWSAG